MTLVREGELVRENQAHLLAVVAAPEMAALTQQFVCHAAQRPQVDGGAVRRRRADVAAALARDGLAELGRVVLERAARLDEGVGGAGGEELRRAKIGELDAAGVGDLRGAARRMFCGLMSQWAIPWARWSAPPRRRSARRRDGTRAPRKVSAASSWSKNSPPRQISVMRWSSSAVSTTSISRRMFGCVGFCQISISRSSRSSLPAASASASFITLSANSRPASFEITRITTPNAPAPSFSIGVYRVESAAFVHTVGSDRPQRGALDGC